MKKIDIIIADDQTLMRDGLKTILELEDNFNILGLASNGAEVLELCRQQAPDIVLMDIRMPEMDGVQCTKELKRLYPSVKVLILTTFNDVEYIIQAINYGAAGYILKDIEGDALIKAINDAYKGQFMLPNDVARKLVNKIYESTDYIVEESKSIEDFTEREMDIAKMMAEGFNNKQIAASLFISEGTVKNYISNIYSKLGTSDRTTAAITIKKLITK
ncbi:response regulator transcription factor [Clostridium sp. 19966]|uniref:response regulator transcription factor n=1 Tax=Clostridium sp. 19966 TaxID=2768166 RepID=UPI0028DEB197|nr:response regulator transcription factor [Clostridium sp. 19966]MDT8717582.1 response regulator transcription factor [Clostridium sp. 19966]